MVSLSPSDIVKVFGDTDVMVGGSMKLTSREFTEYLTESIVISMDV